VFEPLWAEVFPDRQALEAAPIDARPRTRVRGDVPGRLAVAGNLGRVEQLLLRESARRDLQPADALAQLLELDSAGKFEAERMPARSHLDVHDRACVERGLELDARQVFAELLQRIEGKLEQWTQRGLGLLVRIVEPAFLRHAADRFLQQAVSRKADRHVDAGAPNSRPREPERDVDAR